MSKGFKKKAKKLLYYFAAVFTIITLVVIYTSLPNLLARPLTMKPEVRKADVIFVLGGGIYKNGVLGGASNERLIRGMMLYKKGYAPKVAFLGGSIVSVSKKVFHTLSKSEDKSWIDVSEATAMEEVALTLGIPKEDVFVDASSTHTYGNLEYASDLMRDEGYKSCLLVTSPTHMYRVMRVAEKLGLPCSPAPVADYTGYIGGVGRIGFMWEVAWEYAGLTVYKIYGYI